MNFLEVLRDAFIEYRSPTERQAPESLPLHKPSVPPSAERLGNGELKGIVDLSLRLHDHQTVLAGVTTERTTLLVTLTFAFAGVLWAWIQWAPKQLPYAIANGGRGLVAIGLYLGAKVLCHALIVRYARSRQVISPDLVDIGVRCAAGHDVRQDYVDVLHLIRAVSAANERNRCIAVEHSMLGLHTVLAQLIVTAVIGLGSVWILQSDDHTGAPRGIDQDSSHKGNGALVAPSPEVALPVIDGGVWK